MRHKASYHFVMCFIHFYHQNTLCIQCIPFVGRIFFIPGPPSSSLWYCISSLIFLVHAVSQPQPMAHLGSQGTNGRHGLVGSAPRISELEKMSPSDRQVPMGSAQHGG